jgi:hypothetical protein
VKDNERGRALMVRTVMGELHRQGVAQLTDSAFGPLAVSLVDAVLKRHHLLLVNGGAYEVSNVRNADDFGAGSFDITVSIVGTKKVNVLCSWCDRPYGPSSPGREHRLCEACWEDGPCEDDL